MSVAKSKALGKKKDFDVKTGKGMAWRRKDFHKDTRDSFMKELDQHKTDRMKYR